MTNDDELDRCVHRYRASAEDILSPDLDAFVLKAAARHATRRRVMRAAAILGAIAAAAAFSSLAWRAHWTEPTQARVTQFGRLEGSSQAYLLQMNLNQYSEPGLHEGAP
jgi:ferric-dicitrate binding protein FerR (iron transport regulator)